MAPALAAVAANDPVQTSGEVVDLDLALIEVGVRLRVVDHAFAEVLSVAMEESGQLTPVLVRPVPGGRYELVAGGHRHAAVRKLGWATVRAEIRTLSDAEARLIEVDENLIRRDLDPFERAVSIQARLEAWALRYPERAQAEKDSLRPKRGRPSNALTFGAFRMGFAELTAAEHGLSRQTIGNALAVFRGLPRPLHARIAGTWVARSEGVLRQLAGLGDPAEQARVLEVLLRGDTRSVSDARAIVAGRTPSKPVRSASADALKAFRRVWGEASPSAREAILHDLAGRSLPKGWTVTPPEGRA